ncbi:hypothetical protein ACU4GD_07695 [Cupriavidus basilensis]
MDLLAAGLGVTLLPEVGLPGYLAEDSRGAGAGGAIHATPVSPLVRGGAGRGRAALPSREALARDLYRVLVADVESGQGRQRDEPHPVR